MWPRSVLAVSASRMTWHCKIYMRPNARFWSHRQMIYPAKLVKTKTQVVLHSHWSTKLSSLLEPKRQIETTPYPNPNPSEPSWIANISRSRRFSFVSYSSRSNWLKQVWALGRRFVGPYALWIWNFWGPLMPYKNTWPSIMHHPPTVTQYYSFCELHNISHKRGKKQVIILITVLHKQLGLLQAPALHLGLVHNSVFLSDTNPTWLHPTRTGSSLL